MKKLAELTSAISYDAEENVEMEEEFEEEEA